jgi:hypothetical protein
LQDAAVFIFDQSRSFQLRNILASSNHARFFAAGETPTLSIKLTHSARELELSAAFAADRHPCRATRLGQRNTASVTASDPYRDFKKTLAKVVLAFLPVLENSTSNHAHMHACAGIELRATVLLPSAQGGSPEEL